MDSNKYDNSFELFSRRHSTRDVPDTTQRNNDVAKRFSLQTSADANAPRTNSNRNNIEEYNSSSISIISGSRSTEARTPSIKLKPNRKRSTTSDITEKSDTSSKTNRTRGRNSLTSSFLRKKRIEYAGITHFYAKNTTFSSLKCDRYKYRITYHSSYQPNKFLISFYRFFCLLRL